ncbi:MAG: class I SAM-dependent DNA methyltransferase [Acidimicrobiales bacterium]
MPRVPKNYFDGRIALHYDANSSAMFDPAVLDPTVDFLADLAGTGAALELAIGTGRVALPLSERGIRVHGIELSPAMVEQLRAKPGAEKIEVAIGDMATTTVDGSFAVVYLVFNTIMNLTTQEEQVACFRNAAAHLEPGGHFVVEVVVPDLRWLAPGTNTRVIAATRGYVGFDEYTDLGAQLMYSHHWRDVGGKLAAVRAPFRYIWPSELDLMAQLAGMQLVQRWATWGREPFTNDSTSHVSVWQRPSE